MSALVAFFWENLILGWYFVWCGHLPLPLCDQKGYISNSPLPPWLITWYSNPLNRHQQIDSVRYLQGSSTCSNLITISQARIHHLPIELISITSIIWWVREGFKKIPSCPGWLGSEGSIFHKKIKIAHCIKWPNKSFKTIKFFHFIYPLLTTNQPCLKLKTTIK